MTTPPVTVTLGTSGATLDDVVAVARHDARVVLADDVLETVGAVRRHVEALAEADARLAAELPEVALPLFEALRAWRAAEAQSQGVPAYIVFGDATLRGIAVTKPASLEELGGITGIGEKKLEQYGDALLGVVASAA